MQTVYCCDRGQRQAKGIPTFRLPNEGKPLKPLAKKLVEQNGRLSSSGDKSALGEQFAVTFRKRTPKPDLRMPAAVGLFRGPENAGESLDRCRLEQGKEPGSNILWDRADSRTSPGAIVRPRPAHRSQQAPATVAEHDAQACQLGPVLAAPASHCLDTL